MTTDQLEKGKVYRSTDSIKACAWDNDQCAMGEQLDVQTGDELTFTEDAGEDNLIFTRGNATICLHSNDLAALEAA